MRGGPNAVRATTRTNVTRGDPDRERDERTGQRSGQLHRQAGHPELLHQRFQREPFGGEARGQRDPGQGERSDDQSRPSPGQSAHHRAEPVEVGGAGGLLDRRDGDEQRGFTECMRDHLGGAGDQAGGDELRIARGCADQRGAESGGDHPGVFHAGPRHQRGQVGVDCRVSDAQNRGQPTHDERRTGQPYGRRAEHVQGAPHAVEADVDGDTGHHGAGRPGRASVRARHPDVGGNQADFDAEPEQQQRIGGLPRGAVRVDAVGDEREGVGPPGQQQRADQ